LKSPPNIKFISLSCWIRFVNTAQRFLLSFVDVGPYMLKIRNFKSKCSTFSSCQLESCPIRIPWILLAFHKIAKPPEAPCPSTWTESQLVHLANVLSKTCADNLVSWRRIISPYVESSNCLILPLLSEALIPLTFQVMIFIADKENL